MALPDHRLASQAPTRDGRIPHDHTRAKRDVHNRNAPTRPKRDRPRTVSPGAVQSVGLEADRISAR